MTNSSDLSLQMTRFDVPFVAAIAAEAVSDSRSNSPSSSRSLTPEEDRRVDLAIGLGLLSSPADRSPTNSNSEGLDSPLITIREPRSDERTQAPVAVGVVRGREFTQLAREQESLATGAYRLMIASDAHATHQQANRAVQTSLASSLSERGYQLASLGNDQYLVRPKPVISYSPEEKRIATVYRRISSSMILALNVACIAISIFSIAKYGECADAVTGDVCNAPATISVLLGLVTAAFEGMLIKNPMRPDFTDGCMVFPNAILGGFNVIFALQKFHPAKKVLLSLGIIQLSKILVPTSLFIPCMSRVDRTARFFFSKCFPSRTSI